MEKTTTTPLLDTRRFLFESTHGKRAYAQTLSESERPLDELLSHERRQIHQLALGRGALEKAHQLSQEQGNSLESHLFKLVGNIHPFLKAVSELDDIRSAYEGNLRHMDSETRTEFVTAKHKAIEFNHILRDVIETGANKLKYSELLTFMRRMYSETGGRDTARFDYTMSSTLFGIRNEIGFEQILIALGIEHEINNDIFSETKGEDVLIEGEIPIDIKATYTTTKKAQQKAREQGRNPDLIVWSHIENSDFEDRLMLPYDKVDTISQKAKPSIEKAITSYRQRGQRAS